MTKNELLQMALDALKANHKCHEDYDEYDGYVGSELARDNTEAIAALKAELAKPEPEPVMWIWTDISDYIEPDQKSWVKKFNVEPLYRKEDV